MGCDKVKASESCPLSKYSLWVQLWHEKLFNQNKLANVSNQGLSIPNWLIYHLELTQNSEKSIPFLVLIIKFEVKNIKWYWSSHLSVVYHTFKSKTFYQTKNIGLFNNYVRHLEWVDLSIFHDVAWRKTRGWLVMDERP